MEFTVSKSDLVRELSLSQGVVEKKTTIPILSNVLLEAAGDRAAGRVERGGFLLYRPVTLQRPLVEPQPGRDGVEVGLVRLGAAG